MRMWCDRCKGSGGIDKQTMCGLPYKEKCPRCDGKGYSENTEFERLAEIGAATEKAFENDYTVELTYHNDFTDETEFVNILSDVDELLKWMEAKKMNKVDIEKLFNIVQDAKSYGESLIIISQRIKPV